MRALATGRDETTPSVIHLPSPSRNQSEVLVRTLRVGIDGTDLEIISGGHGEFPDGSDYLVLGHEAVGIVEEAPTDTNLEPGDIVVPTVRRPPNGTTNEYFERGEPDMAPPGMYVERGIAGAHGFMAEYFTSTPDYLLQIPKALAEFGYLVEPISIAEKAFELANASRSTFTWAPETGLVLGNGSLGLLTLSMLNARRFERTYCVGRRDRPDQTIDIIESLGGTYIDSRQTPVAGIADSYEPMDIAFEATGFARHAFDVITALAPNGVATLLGLPEPWEFEIDGGAIHNNLVMTNKALIGSVNSNYRHFGAAVETLQTTPLSLLEDLVTDIYLLEDYQEAFRESEGDQKPIKTVIEFSSV